MSSDEPKDGFPFVPRGQRAVLSGKTGSGKTTTSRYLLARSPGSWVILNTKFDSSFLKLPQSIVVEGFNFPAIEAAFRDHRFIIVNPDKDENFPSLCDAFIEVLQEHYHNVGLYVDELYQVHTSGRAGKGLVGWLTRGRSANQSFIGATQRPAWVSRFVYSEAEYYGILYLNMPDDRKRLFEVTGNELVMENPPEKFAWRWFDVASDTLVTYGPVPT